MIKYAAAKVAPALLCAGLGAALLAGPGTLGAATAEDPQPPVTVDNTVTLWPGEARDVDVLANDSNPDGDDLRLCLFPDTMSGRIDAFADSSPSDGSTGEPAVYVIPNGRSGGAHRSFDFYVCDVTTLTMLPETLTVDVREVQPVDVTKVAHHPGRLHVTNHNDRPVVFWYGGPRAERPDGKVKVGAGASTTVTAHHRTTLWFAVIAHRGLADSGVVRDIELPRADRAVPQAGLAYPKVVRTARKHLR